MAVLRWILAVIIFIIVVIAGFYAYLGGFSRITVERQAYGPADIVYRTYSGTYSEIGNEWLRFQADWEAAGLETCDALAIYLDPPDTPQESLRSVLGCRIEGLNDEQRAAIAGSLPVMTLPEAEMIAATFPYRNYLSFMMGPMKVYPVLQAEAEALGMAPPLAIEVYGVMDQAEEILFLMPVEATEDDYGNVFDAFD